MKWNSKKPPKYKPGTRIEVHWKDVVGSSTGNPKDATPAYTTTMGYFIGYKTIEGRKCLVTGLNNYPKETTFDPMGYDVYCVEYIEDIKELYELNNQETPPPDIAIKS
jgi:hypothetical protein